MVPILCLVALCFLAWVIYLKLEIDELKGELRKYEAEDNPEQTESTRGHVKGMRSFTLK
jgi:hypothetical protein